MLANLDPVLLARIQFAFTISFHIIADRNRCHAAVGTHLYGLLLLHL